MKRWLAAIALLIVAVGIALYLFRLGHEANTFEKAESRKGLPGPEAHDSSPQPRPTTQSPPEIVVANNISPAPAPVAAAAAPAASGASVSNTGTDSEQSLSPTPKLAPTTVLENMRTALRDYGSMFEGNPVGNNAEITSALNGNNPKQAKFIRPDSGLRINGKGELIDPWGTPLFFHQISGSETEIRSAGPDKVMWTADDLIMK